ncbi:dihydroxyacetone kinase phosphoryl donor subunit DhaM [Agrococcus jejuensis]|uniref:Phosphocarrier protein HPr n=1 Tax=Agrococcus jejuensis TaxID=399736 RepID=A0A1G8H219_9MICO|nr:dihydroxyacetone kinase phosphoryl donor subunit DhaM [Agrococcus jejuensis]SDI00674.1 Phosphocarrier protein HPr /dihydroxyacetone kinase DhaM subunit [Agrococcus jejuensis]
MSVGLVVVSHSAQIAAGVVELAGQMAGDVAIEAAGGTDDGGIGTSFDLVMAALDAADSGDGVVVLCDLGSAVLTAETALDLLDDDARSLVRIADAPIVEGAVAAAVAAQSGDGLEAVLAAAESAAGSTAPSAAAPVPAGPSRTLTLVNASGLHARPAADLVQLVATFDADVLVNGVDARSMLRILGLGLDRGATVEVSATGVQAQEAVDAVAALVERGFGES